MDSKTLLVGVCYLFNYISLSIACENNGSTIRVVGNGTIFVGCEMTDWKGGTFAAFRGIPFAQPPVGELRFKDPLPMSAYPKVTESRYDGADCPSIFTKISSENCLFLNIYSKHQKPEKLLPVLAFIHPGGFYIGSSSSQVYGPHYLLADEIVVVTFNYRLGSLGFLNLGNSQVPGNAALKDQVMALQWIQDNIRYFGGDPDNVALAGYSAGAISVFLHLISPMIHYLFHRVIIMSGSMPPQTTVPTDNQIELAGRQAKIMGCHRAFLSSQDILNCLNKFSGQEIASTLRKMFLFGKDNPIYPWLPVIEKDFGQERFLTEDPYISLRAGRFHRVPVLIGYNSGEFCASAYEILTETSLTERFNGDFDEIFPLCFMYDKQKNAAGITRSIRGHYLGNKEVDQSQLRRLCELFSDALIRFGAHTTAFLASKYVDVYPYVFTYKGNFSNLKIPDHTVPEHMDDLMYLFQMPPVKFTPDDVESSMVETMTSFFTDFLKNGKPTVGCEFKANTFCELNRKVSVRNGSFFAESSFWNSL